jgi:hypothetical protein
MVEKRCPVPQNGIQRTVLQRVRQIQTRFAYSHKFNHMEVTMNKQAEIVQDFSEARYVQRRTCAAFPFAVKRKRSMNKIVGTF